MMRTMAAVAVVATVIPRAPCRQEQGGDPVGLERHDEPDGYQQEPHGIQGRVCAIPGPREPDRTRVQPSCINHNGKLENNELRRIYGPLGRKYRVNHPPKR